MVPTCAFGSRRDAGRPGWHGHLPLDPCSVTGCNYGAAARGLCNRHAKQWRRAGRPDQAGWLASIAPVPPVSPPAACRIGYCGLWAQATSVFCRGHHERWARNGRPDADEFAASRENPGPGQEHIDLRRLTPGLRLEIQYVLQCRSDEQDTRLPPADVLAVSIRFGPTYCFVLAPPGPGAAPRGGWCGWLAWRRTGPARGSFPTVEAPVRPVLSRVTRVW